MIMISYKDLFDTVKVTTAERVRANDTKFADPWPTRILSDTRSERVCIVDNVSLLGYGSFSAYATHAEAAVAYAVKGRRRISSTVRYLLRVRSTVTLGEYLASVAPEDLVSLDLSDVDAVTALLRLHLCIPAANWLRYVVGDDVPKQLPEPDAASIFDADPAQAADGYARYIRDSVLQGAGVDERCQAVSKSMDVQDAGCECSLQWCGPMPVIGTAEDCMQVSTGYQARQFCQSAHINRQMSSNDESAQIARSGMVNQSSAGRSSYQYADAYKSRQTAAGDGSTQIAADAESRQASCGNRAHHLSGGRGSRLFSAGNDARLKATAENCVMMSAGHGGAACGKVGSWIVLTEWINGEPAVVAKRIDGVEIKADTWYTLRGGQLVEAKPRA